MYSVNIKLKSGENLIVEDLVKIDHKNSRDGSNVSETDFEDFQVYTGYTYRFIGKTIVIISGMEILYLEFSN